MEESPELNELLLQIETFKAKMRQVMERLNGQADK
jgi:hypothetical protein